jgi:serine/threonine protein kinase
MGCVLRKPRPDETCRRFERTCDHGSTAYACKGSLAVVLPCQNRARPLDGCYELLMSIDGRDPLIGERIAGRYVVERRLGQGGMGAIYIARQVPLERRVVLKVLLDALATDPVALARFEKEALAVSRLLHPHIVTLFDFGRMERGGLFIAMEYLPGLTLRQALNQAGRLPWKRTLPIIEGIARGLDEAHRHGIVHRDLKPENIMLVPTGDEPDFPKVLDFGLARTLDPLSETEQKLTQQNMIPGTPAYLAPERVNALADDHRGDLYSLGAMWFELLVGTPPFEDPSPIKLIVMQMQEPVPWMGDRAPGVDVPAGIEKLVRQLLEKKPDRRPAEAIDVVRAIQRHRAGETWAVASLKELLFTPDDVSEGFGEISFSDLAALDAEPHSDDGPPVLLTKQKPIALTQRKTTGPQVMNSLPPLESSETRVPARDLRSSSATGSPSSRDPQKAAVEAITHAKTVDEAMAATCAFLCSTFDRALVLDLRGRTIRVVATQGFRHLVDPHRTFSDVPDFLAMARAREPYIGPRREGPQWRLLHHELSAGLPERILIASLKRAGEAALVMYAEVDRADTRIDIPRLAAVVDAVARTLPHVER